MTDKKVKIAVVLSGCGYMDGAEIQESVLTLLAIEKHGAEYDCFSIDMEQHHVTDHMTGKVTNETRNVFTESARIARGKVTPLKEFDASAYDAIVLPGGFGAATNLSSFGYEGEKCTVHEDVSKAVLAMAAAGKPIGALCIAPAIIATLFKGVELTIGSDEGTAATLERMGAKHTATGHGEVVVDRARRVVTTPCYMLDSTVTEIATGADKVIKSVIGML